MPTTLTPSRPLPLARPSRRVAVRVCAHATPSRRAAVGAALLAAVAPTAAAVAADPSTPPTLKSVATARVTQRAFLDLAFGDGSPAGRIVIDLFGDDAPRTAANFVSFIDGSNPAKKKYAGTPVHRVVKGFVLQGGDVVAGNGTGSTSLYGRQFDDEPGALAFTFDRAGVVAMANRGPNSNGSQWFVTVAATPFLDGKYAVFGRVSEGLDTAIELANTLEVDFTSRPKRGLVVADAGLLPP